MAASLLRSQGRAPKVAGGAPVRHESQVVVIAPAARARVAAQALASAEALLARGWLEEAAPLFEDAARAYDALEDMAGEARALLGLGRVLLGLEDPLCRDVLEDAGTLLEDLGDERAVREIDGLLRIAERAVDGSPRSFHRALKSSRTRASD